MKKRIVVIVGPTAVGKSDYAVDYAIKNNGEIISADSRQVYKGMDIGTGKIKKVEMKGVPHHLLDVADPREQFNVNTFKLLAEKSIEDIRKRGKLPVICGGTGFYIDAVVNNITYPDIPHNEKIRDNLKQKNTLELFNILKKLDSDFTISLNNSEKNNKQRLIRFIEIATTLGKVPKVNKESKYDVTWTGLNMPFEKLKERIHKRLIKRMSEGMIDEVRNLNREGLLWERMDELGLEYRYISKYLRNLISKEEMIKRLELEICHYAKRQLVWFKRNKDIRWIMK